MPRSRSSKQAKQNFVSPEQATAILKEAEQNRIDVCSMELERVLGKHNCIMEPQIIIRGTRIYAQMVVLSNPTPNQGTQMQKVAELPVEEEKEEE